VSNAVILKLFFLLLVDFMTAANIMRVSVCVWVCVSKKKYLYVCLCTCTLIYVNAAIVDQICIRYRLRQAAIFRQTKAGQHKEPPVVWMMFY